MNTATAHLKLQGQDAVWLQEKMETVTNAMGYRLNTRASVDNALRLYLIADKGYTLEQALRISETDPEELKTQFQDFFDKYADESKTPEENLHLLGDMHRRAFEAICDFRLPDFSNVRSVKDLYQIQEFLQGLGNLATDYLQDSDLIRRPEQRVAYYAGAGGKAKIEKLHAHVNSLVHTLPDLMVNLEHPEWKYTPKVNAELFSHIKRKLNDISGKKIGEVNRLFHHETRAMQTMMHEQDTFGPDEFIPDNGMSQYQQYLEGRRNHIPPSPETDSLIQSYTNDEKTEETGQIRRLVNRDILGENTLDGYLDVLNPEHAYAEDLFTIPKEEQDQLQRTYFQLFYTTFSNSAMFQNYEIVEDEFDMIRIRGGESIRQLVDRKYPEADAETKYRAMMMETVRHTLTDGVKVLDVRTNDRGEYELDEGVVLQARSDQDLAAEQTKQMEQELTATRETRLALFRNADGNIISSVDQLSEEQLATAEQIFDRVYGPTINSRDTRNYRLEQPEWVPTEDFFRVGGISLKDYLGKEKYNALSQKGDRAIMAEILRLSTDPAVPLTYVQIGYDPEGDTYVRRDPVHIMDMQDRQHVIDTHPYLATVRNYKMWAKGVYGEEYTSQLNDRIWDDMYQQELHKASREGLVAEDRIISTETLMKESEDPDIPTVAEFLGVQTIYGPKPRFVKEWCGSIDGSNATYTNSEFVKYMDDLPQGQFSDMEFTLVAYLMALSPKVVTADMAKDVPQDMMSHELKVMGSNTMWTLDINKEFLHARPTIGKSFFEDAVRPARHAASRLIGELEAGNPGELSTIMAESLTELVNGTFRLQNYDKPEGTVAQQLHVISGISRLLEKNRVLGDAVYGKLDPAVREEMGTLIRLKEVMDDSLHAKARLERADKEGIPVTPEERTELDRKINAYAAYANLWIDSANVYRKTPEYTAMDSELNRIMTTRIMKNPGSDAPMKVYSNALLKYETDHMKVPKEIKDILFSDHPLDIGNKLGDSVKRLTDYYKQNYDLYIRSKQLLGTGQRYREDLTPEQCRNATRDLPFSRERLSRMSEIVEKNLLGQNRGRIKDAYNRIAREKGWPEISEVKTDGTTVSIDDPDRFKAYFDIVMEEIRRNPRKFAGIEEKLDQILHVAEKDPKENMMYPMQRRILEIKNANRDLPAADREMLEGLNSDLAEVKTEIVDKFCEANSISYSSYLQEEGMLRHSEGFDPATRSFGGMLETRKVSDDDLEIQVIRQDNRDTIKKLMDEPPQMTGATSEIALSILYQMEYYNMFRSGSNMEEGHKIYSHMGTALGRQNLKAAVESGDIDRIREARNAYQEAYEKESLVFQTVKEAFGPDAGIPDNMDTVREPLVPPEFSLDPTTDSRMNGLFLVGTAAKKMGASLKDYVTNPGKVIMHDIKTKLKANGFSSMVPKGTNFVDSINILYDKGADEAHDQKIYGKVFGNGLSPDLYLTRAMGGLITLETDPAKKKDLFAYQRKIGMLADAAATREVAYSTCIYRMLNAEVNTDEKDLNRLKEGLKRAYLEGTGIRKDHLPLAYTGEDGVEKERPAKYEDILSQKDQYNKLKDLYKKNLESAKGSNMDAPKLIIQETMFDYLMAHPEDRNKKEYKELEKLAMNADRQMGLTQPEDPAEREKMPKAVYLKWKQDLKTEMRNMENALRTADMEVNRNIRDLQNSAQAGLRKPNPDRKNVWDKMEEIETMVQNRQKELLESWHKREITDSYFMTRYNDLQEVLRSPFKEPKNPPKLTDEKNPALYEKDMSRINRRINFNFGNGRFKSLESFKEWKLSQPDINRNLFAAFPEVEWKILYNSELYRSSIAQKGTPGWVQQKQAQAKTIIQKHRTARAKAEQAEQNRLNAGEMNEKNMQGRKVIKRPVKLKFMPGKG